MTCDLVDLDPLFVFERGVIVLWKRLYGQESTVAVMNEKFFEVMLFSDSRGNMR